MADTKKAAARQEATPVEAPKVAAQFSFINRDTDTHDVKFRLSIVRLDRIQDDAGRLVERPTVIEELPMQTLKGLEATQQLLTLLEDLARTGKISTEEINGKQVPCRRATSDCASRAKVVLNEMPVTRQQYLDAQGVEVI